MTPYQQIVANELGSHFDGACSFVESRQVEHSLPGGGDPWTGKVEVFRGRHQGITKLAFAWGFVNENNDVDFAVFLQDDEVTTAEEAVAAAVARGLTALPFGGDRR